MTVSWRDGKTLFRRDLFVSRTDDVVAMRIGASQKGKISFKAQLTPHDINKAWAQNYKPMEVPIKFENGSKEGCLTIRGEYVEGGGEFGGVARVVTKGGKQTLNGNVITVEEADEAVILVKIFANEKSAAGFKRIVSEVKAINADYHKLFARHMPEHRELFLRMQIDLAAGDARELVNEQLLLDAYNGDAPTALTERMFDYGRYLLISSSRPGGLPAHLQGLWNGDWCPPWSCMYTNNENVQMTYWQALPGNMLETTLPYFDFYERYADDFRDSAKKIYGCRGFFAPLANTPAHAKVMPQSPHVIYWTAAAGWLSSLFYDYYLFTGDKKFLEERAIPFMKEVAAFYEDFLFEGPDGKFIFSPSNSPENSPAVHGRQQEMLADRPATVNATMDFAIAKEAIGNLCTACEVLGMDEEGQARWRGMLAKMPEYQVNEDGAIREWMHPDLNDNYHHRHESHIYPAFPGFEITKESNPKIFSACSVALDKRLCIGLSSQTGWSLAHMANARARLGQGAKALECLEIMAQSCIGENLFTYHNDWRGQGITLVFQWADSSPFQMDANFGYSAAVMEMLVFSTPGMVKLLPAAPKKWKEGKVVGMVCRGGIEVSMEWDFAKKSLEAKLVSKTTQQITVKFPKPVKSIKSNLSAKLIQGSKKGAAYKVIDLPAGKEVKCAVLF